MIEAKAELFNRISSLKPFHFLCNSYHDLVLFPNLSPTPFYQSEYFSLNTEHDYFCFVFAPELLQIAAQPLHGLVPDEVVLDNEHLDLDLLQVPAV